MSNNGAGETATVLKTVETEVVQATVTEPEAELVATESATEATATSSVEVTPAATEILTETTYRIGKYANITYPDNTGVLSGATFTKTWRLTNGGTATWTPDFKLIYVGGDAMGAKGYILLGSSVAPGESVEVSLQLTAPAATGTYVGRWMLQNESGQNFGLGSNGDVAIWAKIVVEPMFAITAALPSLEATTFTGSCPMTIAVKSEITANRDGGATYYYVTSLGNSQTYDLYFGDAGTQEGEEYDLVVNSTSSVDIAIYNDVPNHQQFETVSISVTCTP